MQPVGRVALALTVEEAGFTNIREVYRRGDEAMLKLTAEEKEYLSTLKNHKLHDIVKKNREHFRDACERTAEDHRYFQGLAQLMSELLVYIEGKK